MTKDASNHFFSEVKQVAVAAMMLTGCNVSSAAPPTTGGVGSDAASGDAVAIADGDALGDRPDASARTCPGGTVVVLTDYTSTQIALSDESGVTLSPAFLSTASSATIGLAFALNGDVVVPNVRPDSGRVVLLDRYGVNVVTWADPKTAKVLGQLQVGTGFESNPQDYIELDDVHAYVSRWGINGGPGAQPFDSGSDVLLLDTKAPAILASLAMPVVAGLPPRPAGMVRIGDTVVVVLQRISEDFATDGESMLVGIQAGAIAWQTTVSGLKDCGRPALSPSGRTMALSCEGPLAANGNSADPSAAAIALFDVVSLPPTPGARFAISDQLAAPPQDQVAFASETLLLGKTQTAVGGTQDNEAFSLDTTTGKALVLATAGKDAQGKGKGIVYGNVQCTPGCGDVCLMADADKSQLKRWTLAGGSLSALTPVVVETAVGLPPVSLGSF